MCLLTTQQKSYPGSRVYCFIQQDPFPVTYAEAIASPSAEIFLKNILVKNELKRFLDKICKHFCHNLEWLERNNWDIFEELDTKLNGKAAVEEERNAADQIAKHLMGFGPKQARNLLMELGLTRYELPLDSNLLNWIKENKLPIITPSIKQLQSRRKYYALEDQLQTLCELAGVFPCILDAAVYERKRPERIESYKIKPR